MAREAGKFIQAIIGCYYVQYSYSPHNENIYLKWFVGNMGGRKDAPDDPVETPK